MKLSRIKTSTLFLDRDGVINHRPINEYVRTWDQFEFLPGVLDAIRVLSYHFSRIIIVTNQQGIGKNLMTDGDLKIIHQKMLDEIHANRGRINAIYYCPDIASKPETCRKPGLTMAKWAQQEFPEIDFKKSIMVGDTKPDMQFGRNAGMTTIYVGIESPNEFSSLIDHQFTDLIDFAFSLAAND